MYLGQMIHLDLENELILLPGFSKLNCFRVDVVFVFVDLESPKLLEHTR